MAMNQPNNQPVPEQAVAPAPEQDVVMEEQAVAEVPAEVPAEAPQVAEAPAPEQQEQQDAMIIEEVAEGLAEEEITAADIMIAVLSDSLGISPVGAQNLFQLLMSELAPEPEVVEEEAAVVEEVPPETME